MKKITRTLMVVLLILFTSGLAGCLDKADSPVATPTPEAIIDAQGVNYGQYGNAWFHGSVIIDNDLTVSDDFTLTDDMTITGDLSVDGTSNLDEVDVDGAVQIDADVAVGVAGTGYDVTFMSDTSGDLMRWQASSESLLITGTAAATALNVVAGEVVVTAGDVTFGADGVGYDVYFNSDTGSDLMMWNAADEQLVITGTAAATALNVADGNVAIVDDLDVDGTTNLDVVAIVGDATQGVNGTGWDFTWYSDTSDDLMRWQASSESLVITGTAAAAALTIVDGNIDLDDDIDVDGTTNLDVTDIDGAVQVDADVTLGTNGTAYDVTFMSDTSDDLMRWQASSESLIITGTNATVALQITDGNADFDDDLDVDGTTNLDVVDIDGAVDFESTIVPNGLINHGCVYSTTTGTSTIVIVASCYVFEPGAAFTPTLGTSGVTTGTQLILINVANQNVIIPDTNIRTTDGNAITMNQYDTTMWIFDGDNWALLLNSANS